MKFKVIRRTFKATKLAIKDEIEEIKSLEITDSDRTQAKAITKAIVAAANSYGVPVGEAVQGYIETGIAYALRDAKEGIATPSNILMARIIRHYKELKKS